MINTSVNDNRNNDSSRTLPGPARHPAATEQFPDHPNPKSSINIALLCNEAIKT